MSDQGRAYVVRHSPYSGSTFLIHYMLGDLENDTHQHHLWMGIPYLALKSRCSKKTIYRALAQMVEDGFLDQLFPETAERPAEYVFLFPETAVDILSIDLGRGGQKSERRWTNRETTPTYITKDNNVATPAEPPTITPSKPKKVYPPEVYELNNYLCELIDHNGSRVPNGGEVEMDALLRIDKMYPPQVRAVIEWCQSDSFWHANILSAKALRKQYDRLRLRMKADGVRLPEPIDSKTLEQAKAWDGYDGHRTSPNEVTVYGQFEPSFPRPQNSNGNLLDGEGRAYYRDPMQPTKRRYLDDE